MKRFLSALLLVSAAPAGTWCLTERSRESQRDFEANGGLLRLQARSRRSYLKSDTVALRNPSAAIYGENSTYPFDAKLSAELARFVTAYRTGMEKLIDLTPYSPLLKRAADVEGKLNTYMFIDTWVGNESGTSIMYMNNRSHTCKKVKHSDGNGWSVSASLIFWPKVEQAKDTRPSAMLSIASGPFGSFYGIGGITVHEGQLTEEGDAVKLDTPATFKSTVDASVYKCQGADSVQKAAMYSYLAQQAELIATTQGEHGLKAFENELAGNFVADQLVQLQIESASNETRKVTARFDPAVANPKVGMAVFYDGSTVYTPQEYSKGVWWVLQYPFERIGNVTHVGNGTLEVRLEYHCVPEGKKLDLPKLVMFKRTSSLPRADELAKSIISVGRQAANRGLHHQAGFSSSEAMLNEEDYSKASWSQVPLLVEEVDKEHHAKAKLGDGRFAASERIGGLKLQSPHQETSIVSLAEIPVFNKSQERVCVVQQQRHGRVFDRVFSAPKVETGGAAVLQLTVTGHGWSATTQQCGEYCHAVYRISFNGVSAANVTQFRDDCKDNPIDGEVQHGTWDESRNGWCPGSIEPGVFLDVTRWLKDGENQMTFDVVVWNDRTQKYDPYIDYGGFALGDAASLAVAMNLFVYEHEAVAAVKSQPHAFTAAEAAIRQGCSKPSALHPPNHVQDLGYQVLYASLENERNQKMADEIERSKRLEAEDERLKLEHTKRSPDEAKALLQLSSRGEPSFLSVHQPTMRGSPSRQEPPGPRTSDLYDVQEHDERYDFEGAAPWYAYNSAKHGSPGASVRGAIEVRLMSHVLMQGASRILQASAPREALPEDWSQVALHLRLSQPENLKYDAWDRVSSFGVLLNESSDEVGLFPMGDPTSGQRWWWHINEAQKKD